jgi:hypothetical protein
MRSTRQWQTSYETDAEGKIYVGPLRKGDLAEFPIYQSPGRQQKVLIMEDLARQVWVPVSQERYIRSRISEEQRLVDRWTRMHGGPGPASPGSRKALGSSERVPCHPLPEQGVHDDVFRALPCEDVVADERVERRLHA